MSRLLLVSLFLLFFVSPTLIAQSPGTETISVFLDCRGCNGRFVQTEIEFVNFVRDQSDADLHIFVVLQRTGSGGWEYTIQFIGYKELEGEDRLLKFISPESDTNDEMRNKLVQYIKLGLIPYLTEKDVLARLDLNFNKNGLIVQNTAPEDDPWKQWIFEIEAGTNFNGEESQKRFNFNGEVSANRITEDWKIVINNWGNLNRRSFTETEEEVTQLGDTVEVEVTEIFDIYALNHFGLVAKTINNHWSSGFYTRIRSSSRDNLDFQFGLTPAIEYSLFPYSEFTRREVTARLGVVASYSFYTDTTIFLKTEEFLLRPELDLRADFTQPWGGFRAGVELGAFVHDFSKNRAELDFRLNMRVFRGFSVFFSGFYSLINDQLFLPAGGSTSEELLLNLQSQSTSYEFGGSMGFEFSFGSIYNNVINPRL